MSTVDWIEIYNDYSDAELTAEIAELRKRVRGGYTSQTSGGKSYSKDLNILTAQLRGATRIKNQRARGSRGRGDFLGVADFSGGVDGSVRNDMGPC
ncbi:hypothetical protein [Verrucomicrobium sp. BvORR034]|uniref:hypothetical protein n=1 Tax=Verrucomicrobium sp. BvORR034 TaxID=1396418 RepID=UPI0006793A59|nr:hypothetical protein [Verrucomicrobium sp. BvORR034]